MNNLRRIRIECGFKQKEVCEKTDMIQQTYSNYETGARNMPVEKAKRIADLFSVNWWELYD